MFFFSTYTNKTFHDYVMNNNNACLDGAKKPVAAQKRVERPEVSSFVMPRVKGRRGIML